MFTLPYDSYNIQDHSYGSPPFSPVIDAFNSNVIALSEDHRGFLQILTKSFAVQ